jgi:hypothetical protein
MKKYWEYLKALVIIIALCIGGIITFIGTAVSFIILVFTIIGAIAYAVIFGASNK